MKENNKFQAIWNIGRVKCEKCKEMKAHCALGMCQKCYNKERRK